MLEGVGDLTCQLVATELMQTCLGHFQDLHGCRQALKDRLFKNIFVVLAWRTSQLDLRTPALY